MSKYLPCKALKDVVRCSGYASWNITTIRTLCSSIPPKLHSTGVKKAANANFARHQHSKSSNVAKDSGTITSKSSFIPFAEWKTETQQDILKWMEYVHRNRDGTSIIITTIVAAALGSPHLWYPKLYEHMTIQARSSGERTDNDFQLIMTTNMKLLKEALLRSTILIGVPRVIEALLLLHRIVPTEFHDPTTVRSDKDFMKGGWEQRTTMGNMGLGRIYPKERLSAIFNKIGPNMRDLEWISRNITYGTFLTPYAKGDPRDAFAGKPNFLSVLTLSALIPQRLSNEIEWHLRGAVRNGMAVEDVNTLRRTIESFCAETPNLPWEPVKLQRDGEDASGKRSSGWLKEDNGRLD